MDWILDIDATAAMLKSIGIWAIIVSLSLSILISVLGVVPSVFLSGANAVVFGLVPGFIVSLAGECLGAAVSFLLYRKGLSKIKLIQQRNWRWLEQFNQSSRRKQRTLLLLARLTPFMPSGLITAAAALSKMYFWDFLLISLLGKAPTIVLETFIGHDLLYLEDNITRLLFTLALGCVFVLVMRKKME